MTSECLPRLSFTRSHSVGLAARADWIRTLVRSHRCCDPDELERCDEASGDAVESVVAVALGRLASAADLVGAMVILDWCAWRCCLDRLGDSRLTTRRALWRHWRSPDAQ